MDKPHFLMVLQTHSVTNSAGDRERFCKASKAEVMRRCTKSLIESANYAQIKLPQFTFELKVFDDHSSDDAVEKLKINLNYANFKTDLEFLETRGIMPSILACYEYGKKHGTDWVYFIQDDYLYEKTAIYDMIMVALDTSEKLQNYTCVFPYNDPYRYVPENTAVQSHIIQSQGRHWRTQIMTGSPFMVHHSIITKEWDVFEAMGKHAITEDMEDKTINQLFRTRGYYLFVPIPSLALHMQYESEKDPFIDWKILWDQFSSNDIPIIDVSNKNLLNIGFGGVSYKNNNYGKDLSDYKEITLDINKDYIPDLNLDITDLSSIPSNSMDCIFCSHVLEYVDYFSIIGVLKEFKRILKQNGFAKIIVTNIQIVGMYLLQDKMSVNLLYEETYINPLEILYSNHESMANSTKPIYKKTGYTKSIIKQIFEHINTPIEIKEVGTDLVVTFKND